MRLFRASAAVVLAALAASASAQQSVTLEAGFMPDPYVIDVAASGSGAAADWVRGCPGHVADAPALTVRYAGDGLPLRVLQLGEGLAALVAVGPDGVYRCAAVEANGTATLRIEPPQAGAYAIWPAASVPGVVTQARLLLSERQIAASELFRLSGADAGTLAPDAPPAFGRHAMGDTVSVPVTIEPVSPADAAGAAGCSGWLNPSRPDIVLRLAGREPSLAIRVSAAADATLVVMAPDGTLYCDDDSIGTDPALVITDAAAGDWAVWAGLFDGAAPAEAVIAFGRDLDTAAPRASVPPGFGAPPASGMLAFDEAGASLPVRLSGRDDAADFGAACRGQIDAARPDAVLRLEAETPTLVLRAEAAAADTTLLVVDPAGAVHCNDDDAGLDPLLALAPAMAGDYAIWVGHWDAPMGTPATLRAGPSRATVGLDRGAALPALRAFDDSPFLGREIPTALAALDILLEDPEAAAGIRYASREALGDDGFVLRDVTIDPPDRDAPPLSMRQLRVTELDLDGMAETGAPGTFRLNMIGIDYKALAAELERGQQMVLPGLDQPGTLGAELSLLPPLGDETRRDAAMSLSFEGQIGFGLSARLLWPEGPGLPREIDALPAETVTVELTNEGYVGLALRTFAEQIGMAPGALGSMMLGGLSQAMAPVMPGSPKARLLDVLGELVSQPDGSGVVRMALRTETPEPVEELFDRLERAEGTAPPGITLDFAYDPMP